MFVALLIAIIVDKQENELTGTLRKLLSALYEHLQHLDKQIAIHSTELQQLAKQSDKCKRLVKIPGIGLSYCDHFADSDWQAVRL